MQAGRGAWAQGVPGAGSPAPHQPPALGARQPRASHFSGSGPGLRASRRASRQGHLGALPRSSDWTPPSLPPTQANGSPTSGLSTGAIVGILVVTFVLLLVAVDVTCYFLNKCGLLMCIAVILCGKAGPGAKGKDMEEVKAAFS